MPRYLIQLDSGEIITQKDLVARLIAISRACGMTRAALAEEFGVTRMALNYWQRAERGLTLEQIAHMESWISTHGTSPA